tara:strand:+ start:873 stop:1622 length:750 start_codon:yes stop_codon:yes gene_type:complete
MAYLDDHPPRLRQFRDRGTTASGVIVIHTAESYPDESGPDGGAEAVARFIQGRTNYGSYHWLADSDSLINVVRMDQQAYGDGTGSNPHAIHVSFACSAADWPGMSAERKAAFIRNGAIAAKKASDYVYSIHGVHVPARRITRAQSDQRVEGFISHGERDPGRRTDPGPAFPWADFLDTYAALNQEDDMANYADQLDDIQGGIDAILSGQAKAQRQNAAIRSKVTKLVKKGNATRADLEDVLAALDNEEN